MAGVHRVEIFRDAAGAWRWRAVAANGQQVAASGEGYEHRGHARRMAAEQHPDAELVEVDPATGATMVLDRGSLFGEAAS